MATIAYTVEQPVRGVTIVTWASLANGDDGAPFEAAQFPRVRAQVSGIFGSGGTVKIEGSLYTGSATYAVLNDLGNAALSITAATLKAVQETAYRYRPNVTEGDGATSLTVKMLVASGAH